MSISILCEGRFAFDFYFYKKGLREFGTFPIDRNRYQTTIHADSKLEAQGKFDANVKHVDRDREIVCWQQ
jgi:hypothetical protein